MNIKRVSLISLSLFAALGFSLSLFANENYIKNIVRGDIEPFTLLLNETQKINASINADSNENSAIVKTDYKNDIEIKFANVINNTTGWQSILPGGYFYNPINNYSHLNKISGIQSIQFFGTGSLELHYGYTLNNTEIIYSTEIDLDANVEVHLNNGPSYFYIKNVSDSNVDISSLKIKYSCSEEQYPNNNLKVLMIGNSFADDTVFYGTRIANSLGINIELFDAYIAGCTLDTHFNNLLNDTATYSMRSMNGSSWNYQDNKTLSQIVTYKDWDIITFQQASAEIGRTNTYGNLTNLVNQVKSIVTGSPKYYWHQTWAYDNDYSEYYDYFSYFNNDQETMYNALVNCYKTYVEPTGLFEKTIFNGTAVQNIRTSYMGDNFSRDGKHMSNVHGRYLLTSNFLSTIYDIDLDLTPIPFIPDGMNRSYQKLVNETVRNTRKHNDVITPSALVDEDIAQYNLSEYEEIDAGLVGCSYYNCQDSSAYNIRNNHVDGTSNKYVSTYRFTKDMLPVGSLIYLREGYGYRPEAWISDSVQSSRKSETCQNVLEIDESFWDEYTYRAFNIFKSGKLSLSGQYVDEQYDEIFDAFHIYVPKTKMGGLTPKNTNTYYSQDQTNFANHGLDIDDYHRLHLDPITGFYKCDELYYLFNKYVDSTAKRFVCTRPFWTKNNDLPNGTVIIVDSGYQWRSDCWTEKSTTDRPGNVSTNFYTLDSSFMSPYRRRTFNISRTNNYTEVGQQSIEFMNHFRIYVPNN